MGKYKMDPVLSVVFLFVLISSCAVSAQLCFESSGVFTPSGTYDVNRRALLSSPPSSVTANNDFYMTSMGQDQNRAYGLGMCIPGSDRQYCSNCIAFASDGLIDMCTRQKASRGHKHSRLFVWYVYSNRSFFGSLEIEPVIQSLGKKLIRQVGLTEFDNAWKSLMLRVIAEATSGSTPMFYGADKKQLVTTSLSIYGFVQCSKDISASNCGQCLRQNVYDYRSCCSGIQRGITERPSCFMRWDLDPFFGVFDENISPTPSPEKV